jgi:hypothetical protein
MGLTAGVTGQQGMLTPPWHLILPLHLSEVRVALLSICICPLDYDYVLHIVNFAVLYPSVRRYRTYDEARYVTTRRYATNCYIPNHEWRHYVTFLKRGSQDI